jgi:glycosyltransferase involved in cell wall biosynthesis
VPQVVLDLRKWDDYGIGTYLKVLTAGLKEAAPDGLEFQGLHPRPGPSLPFPSRPFDAPDYSPQTLLGLGRAARKAGADLLHIPHFTLPLFAPPAVLTVHDLIHLRFPERYGRVKTAVLGRYLRWAFERARAIITVSEASRADLLAFMPRLAAKVRTIPNAALPEFYGRPDCGERRHYLFIGNDKPHKDLPVLLEAWARFHAAHPDRRLILVTPGEFSGPGLESRRAVPREELPRLLASAQALVAPSRWEGFDLPVLEAVLSRTPVVASDIPAHLELLGADHPLLFPAGNAGALRMRLEEAERHGASEERLDALRERHLAWTPRAMAEATAAVYREALAAGR